MHITNSVLMYIADSVSVVGSISDQFVHLDVEVKENFLGEKSGDRKSLNNLDKEFSTTKVLI